MNTPTTLPPLGDVRRWRAERVLEKIDMSIRVKGMKDDVIVAQAKRVLTEDPLVLEAQPGRSG